GFLQGPPADWAEQLAGLTLEHGTSVFILAVAPGAGADLRRYAGEVAPAVRDLVAAERRRRASGEGAVRGPAREAPPAAGPSAAGAVSAASAGGAAGAGGAGAGPVSAVGRAGQQTLVAIHDHLRQELARLRQ